MHFTLLIPKFNPSLNFKNKMPEAIICPQPTAVTTIPAETCRTRPAKFAKVIFQEALSTNYFDGTASPSKAISLANSWSGLPDASDDTKVAVSGYIFNGGEIAEATVFTGGENIHGNTRNIGVSGNPVTLTFKNPTKGEMAAYKDLLKFQSLWVIFIDASGNFYCNEVATSIHSGFTISPDTLVITDPQKPEGDTGELESKIMFAFAPGWSETATVVAPAANFNPLTAIVPA